MWHTSTTERAYTRELPGGGYAAIEVSTDTPLFGRPTYRGVLVVERRGSSRRDHDEPPVVAAASGLSSESVIRQLLSTAQSNAAIGLALIQRARQGAMATLRTPSR
jgi:hypothetical protein